MSTSTTYQMGLFEKILYKHWSTEPYSSLLYAVYRITQKNKGGTPLRTICKRRSIKTLIKRQNYNVSDIFTLLGDLVLKKLITHSSPMIDGKTVDAYKFSEEALPLVKKLLEEGKTTKTTQVA